LGFGPAGLRRGVFHSLVEAQITSLTAQDWLIWFATETPRPRDRRVDAGAEMIHGSAGEHLS
jgi:hypothetical protein